MSLDLSCNNFLPVKWLIRTFNFIASDHGNIPVFCQEAVSITYNCNDKLLSSYALHNVLFSLLSLHK
jgi:uncharacterized membrane protein